MPCMGPDLTEARKHGREVGAKLLARLIKDNYLWDITDSKWDKCFGRRAAWIKAKKKFVKVVEELFIEDACNSF